MRKIVIVAGLAALTTACTDTSTSLLAPGDAPALSLTGDHYFWLSGFTAGPNMTIVNPGSGSWQVCGSMYVSSPGTNQWVWLQNHCESYAIGDPGPGAGETYDGGQVQVHVVEGGQSAFLGTGSGDIRQRAQIYDIPAGATVQLSALPNSDCQFDRWDIDGPAGVSSTFDATIHHTSANSGGSYRANFSCPGSGGGPGGW